MVLVIVTAIFMPLIYERLFEFSATSRSVRVKSLPTQRSGCPAKEATAYAMQSPKFKAAGWRPFPKRRNARCAIRMWASVNGITSISRPESSSISSGRESPPSRRANTIAVSTTVGARIHNVERSSLYSLRTLAVFAPITSAFSDGSAQAWRDIRHNRSRIEGQVGWQNSTLFEQEECSGLPQCKEVFLLD